MEVGECFLLFLLTFEEFQDLILLGAHNSYFQAKLLTGVTNTEKVRFWSLGIDPSLQNELGA